MDTEPANLDEIALNAVKAFINKHFILGTGRADGNRWTGRSFADASRILESTISNWRQKRKLISFGNLDTAQRIFFPDPKLRSADPHFREWQRVREVVSHAQMRIPLRPEPDEKQLSLREFWDYLSRAMRSTTIPLVRSSAEQEDDQSFSGDRITATCLDKSFILPMPGWFTDAVMADSGLARHYDLHTPVDFAGDDTLDDFYGSVPVHGFDGIVAYHMDRYAAHVLETLRRRPTYPPFNKKKLGLFAYQQSQRADRDEGLFLDLDFYVTDYFTHRVMRRVFADLLQTHPYLFADDPDLFGERYFLRYFVTSFGINVIATSQESEGKRFFMAQLSSRQGYANQHGRWHVSANEGLNLDDVENGAISLDRVAARALKEEMGVGIAEKDSVQYFELAIDRRNFEPFISCLVHLEMDCTTLLHRKQHFARDDRREFQSTSDIAFTEQAIIEWVMGNPNGLDGFTSYGLSMLDSIITRQLAPRMRPAA